MSEPHTTTGTVPLTEAETRANELKDCVDELADPIIEAGTVRRKDNVPDASIASLRNQLINTFVRSFPPGIQVPAELTLLANAVEAYNKVRIIAIINKEVKFTDDVKNVLLADLLPAALGTCSKEIQAPSKPIKLLIDAVVAYNSCGDESTTRVSYKEAEKAAALAWSHRDRDIVRKTLKSLDRSIRYHRPFSDYLNEARLAIAEALHYAEVRVMDEIKRHEEAGRHK